MKKWSYLETLKLFISYKHDFNYDSIEYVNSKTDIIVYCNKHGNFVTKPYYLKNKTPCPSCKIQLKENIFKSRSKEINPIYNYDKVIYINNCTPVIIICKEHGEFCQTPNNHLNKKLFLKNINIVNGLGINY